MLQFSLCKSGLTEIFVNIFLITVQIVFIVCLSLYKHHQDDIELAAHQKNRYDWLIAHLLWGSVAVTAALVGFTFVQILNVHRHARLSGSSSSSKHE